MSFLVFLLFEIFLSEGHLSLDHIKLSEGVPASISALRTGRRVGDMMESPFTVVVLSE